MNRRLAGAWPVLLLLAAGAAAPTLAAERHTAAELLRRVVDLERLTQPPTGERYGLITHEDLPAGTEAAAQDAWRTIARLDGPGVITRIWFAVPTGALRIVLDGHLVADAPLSELLTGKVQPFAVPLVLDGRTLLYPLGFQEGCQIQWRGGAGPFEIQYSAFPAGTQVERFDPDLSNELRKVRTQVIETLLAGTPPAGGRMLPVAVQRELAAGEKLTEQVDGAGTIRALRVAVTDRIDPREPYTLHRCVLRLYFDGAEEPSVAAPLTDFFGSGFDLVTFRSFPAGTDLRLEMPLPDRYRGEERFMYCRFPMPFRDGVRIEIENLNERRKPIGLLLNLRVDLEPPAEDALRFHAAYRRVDPLRGGTFEVARLAGRGRLVGMVLNVDCPRVNGWADGAWRIAVDDAAVRANAGIVAYFGGAGVLRQGAEPLHGVTRTGAFGKTSAYRWHVASPIEFQDRLAVTIDSPAAAAEDTYFGAVAYWYADAATSTPVPRLTVAELDPPGLRIPGSVEVEGHILTEDWGHPLKQVYGGGAEFSGEEVATIATEAPVRIGLPVGAAGRYVLGLRTHPDRPFGEVVVRTADGTEVGRINYDRAADGLYRVGEVTLKAGANVLEVQCEKTTLLDCWVLERVEGDVSEPQ
jgi:hypothetical protein